MDRMTTVLLTVLYVLGLWLGEGDAEGKCRGLWKNHHACLGGNGKRADPSESLTGDERTGLLETLLTANDAPSSETERYSRREDEAFFEPRPTHRDTSAADENGHALRASRLLRRLITALRANADDLEE